MPNRQRHETAAQGGTRERFFALCGCNCNWNQEQEG